MYTSKEFISKTLSIFLPISIIWFLLVIMAFSGGYIPKYFKFEDYIFYYGGLIVGILIIILIFINSKISKK